MATQWLRRAWLLAACASALLLAACGGGIESQFTPSRLVAFGDAMADLGQNGNRYTVNDGSQNNWTQYVADRYGLPLAPSSAGGRSYATGNARVTAKPDAAGSNATATVEEQISAFLASDAPNGNDLVIVNAGTSDVITQVQAELSGGQSEADMLSNAGQAGRDLAAQVRRLLDAGAKHVVVVGTFNLGRTPWAIQTDRKALMEAASGRFNDQLLVSMVDLGDRVLYVDAALYFNLVTGAPGNYGLNNADAPVCTSVDAGAGIGTGTGQVNSNLCTSSTVLSGVNPDTYLFADRVYPTPRAHRLFGEYAFNRIHERW